MTLEQTLPICIAGQWRQGRGERYATRYPATYDAQLAAWLNLGASPRGAISLDRAARANAWLEGQSFISPDDVRRVLHPVLRHRLQLSYDAIADGVSTDQVLDRLLDIVAIPA